MGASVVTYWFTRKKVVSLQKIKSKDYDNGNY